MRCLLFRKLEIDGVNYYQYYSYDKDFEVTSEYADYDSRASKDYFYIDYDDIPDFPIDHMYLIFCDSDDKMVQFGDDELLPKILEVFQKKFNDFTFKSTKLESINDVVESFSKKILFQKNGIRDLLKRIYQNQEILMENLPLDFKVKRKKNILLHGPSGTGKKTLCNLIGKELSLPTAYINLPEEPEGIISKIFDHLTRDVSDEEDVSNGIVFFSDDFDEFNEESEKLFKFVNYLSKIGKVKKPDSSRIINFSTLTFVVLLDEDEKTDYKQIMETLDFKYEVEFDKLSEVKKRLILYSPNGSLRQCEKYLNSFDKKLIVNNDSLKKLIHECSLIDGGMNALNDAIDIMMDNADIDGPNDMIIDDESVHFALQEIKSNKEIYQRNGDGNLKISEISVDEVFNQLKEKVIGQDEHIKRILDVILSNRRMANRKNLDDPKQYIENILIRGESGGGKSFILNNIAKILNIPIFIADATQYTEAGYVGDDIKDMLVDLYHAADDDLEEAEKGILVIDEVDKKSGNSGKNSDVSRGAVLNGLLKIIEGAKIPVNVGTRMEPNEILFDTSRLTVICAGAFENIEEIRDERLRKSKGKTIGFNDDVEEKFIDPNITTEDYVNFGMKRQFMARLPVIVNLNKNTELSLKNIMLNSSSSALKIMKIKLEDKGFEIEYTPDFYDELAKMAINYKVGARGIKSALERILSDIHISDINPIETSKIIFNGKVITNPNEIILIPREKEKIKKK